ncbi:MAG: hypothetical protein L6R38_002001 [Xanthoria sp. 2 TBL-2021]|nr:MAG: hypothetical protein L6R38_002001 [Xanthoria sp. 2 TBL-2021]
MPTSDYISAGGGGLRLKGVDPSSKITKHKKKRPKPSSDPTTSVPKSKELQEPEHANPDPDMDKTPNENSSQLEDQDQDQDRRDGEEDPRGGKTEAEIRHEERRRRRLEERLKREGTKTHKEKVEEFNHYLSNLSEHHDMPRIGPG